jgi:hypothetical protein
MQGNLCGNSMGVHDEKRKGKFMYKRHSFALWNNKSVSSLHACERFILFPPKMSKEEKIEEVRCTSCFQILEKRF